MENPRLFPPSWRVTLCWVPILACSAAAAPETAAATLKWPEVTSETKPWSRWWWLGNILEEGALTSEMTKYAAAGLGGLEITPIYGVRGHEQQFIEYLSPLFMERMSHVLAEAQRLGLGLDMATGTGWPFGGPWVGEETACKYLAHRKWDLSGGARLQEPVRLIEQPFVRTAGARRVEIGELVEPVSANPDLQDLALDQVRFPRSLPLVALVADAGDGRVEELTHRVGADGMLDWEAPPGDWALHAVFQGWHGKMVERAAPGGEGNVIDHFSAEALAHYLARFDEAFAGSGLGGLRAFYNDSYEVDDASGESNWTPRFFDEFSRRRGYDLRHHLPALFGAGDADRTSRVLSDYRETISDLLLDEFTVPWRGWANAKGSLVRNQAHGSPANILDLYAASDIPEQEGTDLLAVKLASSAAHVMGRRLTAAETATWINEHFLGTLGEVKAAVDLFFLGGVNHNCYHGTALSPPGEPWPGFHFYASIELNPSNPIWRDLPVLNAYVTRAQSFLQMGGPDEDVLLYFNIHDRWGVAGDRSMPHFHGRENEGMTTWREAARSLLGAGFGFDAVSDRQIGELRSTEGELVSSGGTRYRAIVLPETRLMPLETMAKLFDLARAGAIVIAHRSLPLDVPGLGQLAARRSEFQVFADAVRRNGREDRGVTTVAWGRGRILIGNDLPELFAMVGLRRERLVDQDLAFVRRQGEDGHHYFLLNRGPERLDGWVPVAVDANDVVLFDTMTGEIGRAVWRREVGGGSEVYLQLDPGQSMIVKTQARPAEGGRFAYWRALGDSVPLAGRWSVRFVDGGPDLPKPVEVAAPASWTEIAGDAGQAFGGTGVYRLEFARPDGRADGWLFDLGSVAESARVRLNGSEIAATIQAPHRVQVPASRLRARNTLEIEVTNLAANRIADLDRRGVTWRKFYNINMPARRPANRGPDGLFSAAACKPRPSGLLGPVTLTPLGRLDPRD